MDRIRQKKSGKKKKYPINIKDLAKIAANKDNFSNLQNYVDFCKRYLNFITDGLQATIVSQNENHYLFFQYKKDGNFNVTRPINSELIYDSDSFSKVESDFVSVISNVRDVKDNNLEGHNLIKRGIYTIQQSIGAALDALPAGMSNNARKVNGDLFERFIQLLIKQTGVKCESGTVQIPVYVNDEPAFNMSYQHDILLYEGNELKVIGSVKTSSKDRIDKIFIDKFLYSKLTGTSLPHIAIFLNDVQRKKTRKRNKFGINATFLSGHFKAYTIKLNPLDGVYYCDIRPNMEQDDFLKQHIKTIDHFFCSDIWSLTSS